VWASRGAAASRCCEGAASSCGGARPSAARLPRLACCADCSLDHPTRFDARAPAWFVPLPCVAPRTRPVCKPALQKGPAPPPAGCMSAEPSSAARELQGWLLPRARRHQMLSTPAYRWGGEESNPRPQASLHKPRSLGPGPERGPAPQAPFGGGRRAGVASRAGVPWCCVLCAYLNMNRQGPRPGVRPHRLPRHKGDSRRPGSRLGVALELCPGQGRRARAPGRAGAPGPS
jgi:hypothetical protein